MLRIHLVVFILEKVSKMYNQIVVCEGTHDMIKIQSVYKDLKCIITNGSEISDDTLKLIKEYSKKYEIILFLDPDYPGERIRSKVLEVVPNARNAYIEKKVCISQNHKKVGVEHASMEDIKRILDPILNTRAKRDNPDITINDIYELGIVGNKGLREYISGKYNIGNPNNKTLIKRLNSLDITLSELKKVVGEYNA